MQLPQEIRSNPIQIKEIRSFPFKRKEILGGRILLGPILAIGPRLGEGQGCDPTLI
jgi:hypothetical protein